MQPRPTCTRRARSGAPRIAFVCLPVPRRNGDQAVGVSTGNFAGVAFRVGAVSLPEITGPKDRLQRGKRPARSIRPSTCPCSASTLRCAPRLRLPGQDASASGQDYGVLLAMRSLWCVRVRPFTAVLSIPPTSLSGKYTEQPPPPGNAGQSAEASPAPAPLVFRLSLASRTKKRSCTNPQSFNRARGSKVVAHESAGPWRTSAIGAMVRRRCLTPERRQAARPRRETADFMRGRVAMFSGALSAQTICRPPARCVTLSNGRFYQSGPLLGQLARRHRVCGDEVREVHTVAPEGGGGCQVNRAKSRQTPPCRNQSIAAAHAAFPSA